MLSIIVFLYLNLNTNLISKWIISLLDNLMDDCSEN